MPQIWGHFVLGILGHKPIFWDPKVWPRPQQNLPDNIHFLRNSKTWLLHLDDSTWQLATWKRKLVRNMLSRTNLGQWVCTEFPVFFSATVEFTYVSTLVEAQNEEIRFKLFEVFEDCIKWDFLVQIAIILPWILSHQESWVRSILHQGAWQKLEEGPEPFFWFLEHKPLMSPREKDYIIDKESTRELNNHRILCIVNVQEM